MDTKVNQRITESESGPFRRFIKRHISKDDSFESQGRSFGTSMASISGNNGDPLLSSEEFVRDESALLSLHPWFFRKESYGEGMSIGVDGSRGSLRSRRLGRFSVKPVTFTGNYITPFTEHVGMEEYVLSSPPNSPVLSLRPFVVTDGSRIISKSSFDSFDMQPENGLYREDLLHKEADGASVGAKRAVIGIPLLPDSRKLRRKSIELQHGRAEASNSQKPCKALRLEGSLDDMLPFCVGISIGMISGLLLKRTEVDKFKLLKQTEDLVQDLQEELEMKDTLSVKELTYGTYESQKLKHWNSKREESTELWQNHNLTPHSTSRDEHDSPHLNKAGENPEPLSKIEAELEAELERLEQNMNACNLDQRMSELIELDPDLIAEVIHGELRVDNLAREILESQANSSGDTNSSTTDTYNANYSVSPKELSLRLHQVIQNRLEKRTEELNRELLRSQRQLQVMEAERVRSHRTTFSNSDMGFSSTHDSPRAMPPNSAPVHPFCLNMSGDTLNAYDEAYEEFMQVAGKEENIESLDGYKSTSSCRTLPWDNVLWSRESNERFKYEEEEDCGESGGFSDEEGKMLIQQLVEKKRRGSTNAQKMFLLMEE